MRTIANAFRGVAATSGRTRLGKTAPKYQDPSTPRPFLPLFNSFRPFTLDRRTIVSSNYHPSHTSMAESIELTAPNGAKWTQPTGKHARAYHKTRH